MKLLTIREEWLTERPPFSVHTGHVQVLERGDNKDDSILPAQYNFYIWTACHWCEPKHNNSQPYLDDWAKEYYVKT